MKENTEEDKKQERIAYWQSVAQYDLDTAEAMLKTGRFLYVGFMCHQAIEKMLKAHFVKSRNNVPPFHHNLAFFAEESGILKQTSEEQKVLISFLQPLNVESRYPSYKNKIFQTMSEDRCRSLLSQTKELYLWLSNLL